MAKKRDPRSWAVWGALLGLIVGRLCYDGHWSSINLINICLYAGTIVGAICGFMLAKRLNANGQRQENSN